MTTHGEGCGCGHCGWVGSSKPKLDRGVELPTRSPLTCTCGHPWDWHGPGKDCIACGCMWFEQGADD